MRHLIREFFSKFFMFLIF